MKDEDELIQELGVEELRQFIKSSTFVLVNTDAPSLEEQEEDSKEIDQELMDYSAEELKAFIQESSSHSEHLPLQTKIQLTGLSQATIKLIETNRQKATLEQIMSYCTGLNIRYEAFLPELFTSEPTTQGR